MSVIQNMHYVNCRVRSLTLLSALVIIFTTTFNIRKLYVLPTQCIYVFCWDLRTNNDKFSMKR